MLKTKCSEQNPTLDSRICFRVNRIDPTRFESATLGSMRVTNSKKGVHTFINFAKMFHKKHTLAFLEFNISECDILTVQQIFLK
jgi:hypothetical protein